MDQDYQEAARLYAIAHQGGYPPAACALGLCYEMGRGVAEDKLKATEYYRQAAEKGNVTAQCNLGYCYYTGIGVEEDDGEAAKWFAKAAGQGQPRALFLLGECYEEGHGVGRDLKQARSLYQKAADKGYRSAKEALERLDSAPKSSPSSSYTYIPPASGTQPKKPEVKEKAKEKPKRGGLFGFFKK